MSEPFLAEIRIMSFNYAPKGWAQCNGQFLPINQNQALFSLLGTIYGGNGSTNFQLPDLRERVPIHFGSGHNQGERAGEAAHTVTSQEMPAHTHFMMASSNVGDQVNPTSGFLAAASNVYRSADTLVALHPQSVTNTGGSQPHENRQPYLVLTFCIALQGIFPART